jgi:hypothetical protein
MRNSAYLSFLLTVVVTISVQAQVNQHGVDSVGRSQIDTSTISESQKSVAEQQLIKIKISELPASVTNKLKTDSYQDWVIQDAYKNLVLKQYSVRLKKGNDVVFYTFNYNGERIKD